MEREPIPFRGRQTVEFRTAGATALKEQPAESYLHPVDQLAPIIPIATAFLAEEEFDKVGRDIVGSESFNLEYLSYTTDAELRDDIISYLGEYRLNIPKFRYGLIFSKVTRSLVDTHRFESLRIKSERVLKERKRNGEPVHREEAEKKGIISLEKQLSTAKKGDTIIWGSPPGPQEQGYGDYGFIYVGKVTEDIDKTLLLDMTAIRVEKATTDQYNSAFSELLKTQPSRNSAEEFIANPLVISYEMPEATIDVVFKNNFFLQVSEEEQARCDWVIKQLSTSKDPKKQSKIAEFVTVMRQGSRSQKLQAFYTLENLAIQLAEKYDKKDIKELKQFKEHEFVLYDAPVFSEKSLYQLMPEYAYKPPVVRGSCGSTGSVKSNSILGGGMNTLVDSIVGGSGEQEWFTCPKCTYKADGPVGNSCPGCGLTKEAYAAEAGVVCE